jgi:hypothetical protein
LGGQELAIQPSSPLITRAIFPVWFDTVRNNFPQSGHILALHDKSPALEFILPLTSKKQKGLQNRKKLKTKLARLHAKISNIRKDALHKLTSDIARRFDTIVEDMFTFGGICYDF